MLDVRDLELLDLKLLEPRRFGDDRGFFREVYNAARFESLGLPHDFIQDNHSRSADIGTLRGLHFQTPPDAQTKLIWVTRGAILDCAVDLRKGSPTFGRHVLIELRENDGKILMVPKGFAHGFVTVEPETEVIYKVDAPYSPENDKGVAYDDPDLAIAWPELGVPFMLSEKDRKQPSLSEVEGVFRYGEIY